MVVYGTLEGGLLDGASWRCRQCSVGNDAYARIGRAGLGLADPGKSPWGIMGKANRSEQMIGTRMQLSESLRSARSGMVPTDAV
jgi:hypothetical protein